MQWNGGLPALSVVESNSSTALFISDDEFQRLIHDKGARVRTNKQTHFRPKTNNQENINEQTLQYPLLWELGEKLMNHYYEFCGSKFPNTMPPMMDSSSSSYNKSQVRNSICNWIYQDCKEDGSSGKFHLIQKRILDHATRN